jgi:hypothetical protein
MIGSMTNVSGGHAANIVQGAVEKTLKISPIEFPLVSTWGDSGANEARAKQI